MPNTVELPIMVLAMSAGEFKDDSTGQLKKYSSAQINFGGREFKFNSEKDLTQYIGMSGKATVKIEPKGGAQNPLSPKITILDFSATTKRA